MRIGQHGGLRPQTMSPMIRPQRGCATQNAGQSHASPNQRPESRAFSSAGDTPQRPKSVGAAPDEHLNAMRDWCQPQSCSPCATESCQDDACGPSDSGAGGCGPGGCGGGQEGSGGGILGQLASAVAQGLGAMGQGGGQGDQPPDLSDKMIDVSGFLEASRNRKIASVV